MRKLTLFLCALCTLYGQEIQEVNEVSLQNEYGKNLYENPRGIACNQCHGDRGEESVIAYYKHKGVKKTLIAPRINNLEFSVFEKALRSQKGVMPRYYLTNEEITAVYMYLYRP